jgi:uncharacterized membrane protein YphA (DoxX/SURF4 family)
LYIDTVTFPKSFRRIFLLLGRLTLAAIFLYYGYVKLKPVGNSPWSVKSVNTSLILFAFQVDAYELLSHSAAIEVAKLLPPFELLLGVWLLSGFALRYSALCTSLLIGGFLFALIWAYAHGLKIDCGCGGHEQVGPRKIIEDLLMLSLAAGLSIAAFKARSANGRETI